MEGVPKRQRQEKVLETAKILRLNELLERKPKELSGGQRQRVAIGRAIVRKPKVFLFDEPLSNLDSELRVQMRVELARLHREIGATMIYVTHDQVEAMTLADRIVVMRGGNIEQFGRPMELYNTPANMFVAGFIGSPKMNFLSAIVEKVDAGKASVSFEGFQGGSLTFDLGGRHLDPDAKVTVGIRPELLTAHMDDNRSVEARIDFVEQLGNTSYAHAMGFRAGALIAIASAETGPAQANQVRKLGFSVGRCFLFDGEGRMIACGREGI